MMHHLVLSFFCMKVKHLILISVFSGKNRSAHKKYPDLSRYVMEFLFLIQKYKRLPENRVRHDIR